MDNYFLGCGRYGWMLYVCGLALLLLMYTCITIPMKYSLSGHHITMSAPHTLNTPAWERILQFLDKVDAFHYANDDPLAMKLGILAPKSTGKIRTAMRNNVNSKSINHVKSQVPQTLLKSKQHQKMLVVVNHPGWNWIRMGNIALNDCPVGCSLTDDTSQILNADAVIFYAVGMRIKPPSRPKGQIWIFFSLESPVYSLSKTFSSPVWHGQVNWTMTYRSDSDIWYPYGRVNRRKDPLTTNYTAIALKKTKQAAWFVSHCSTHSRREDYVSMLQKHVTVDIFGPCGTEQCGPEGSSECFKMLTDKYKFYIAFENAFCDDYITEKIFRKIMMSDVVPIVRGSGNYTRYLPPRSYINVADFSSVASLADYLKYLDKNITAYSEYLEWRRYYFVVEKPNPTCEVCMKLTEPEKYQNVYKNVYSWWNNGQCHIPKPIA